MSREPDAIVLIEWRPVHVRRIQWREIGESQRIRMICGIAFEVADPNLQSVHDRRRLLQRPRSVVEPTDFRPSLVGPCRQEQLRRRIAAVTMFIDGGQAQGVEIEGRPDG
ncbi:hypothetical protein ACFQZ4_04275 [Catellatospora coxensis]